MSKEEKIEEQPKDDISQSTENENVSEENIPHPTLNIQHNEEVMEVHKHPHHVTHKKKWGEYLLEFFMLFLAVFLGFIAENIREEKTDEKKEKQYMRYMVEDLTNDTSIVLKALKRCEFIINHIDTASVLLVSGNLPDSSTRKLYQLNLQILKGVTANFTDRTSSQLKNAGAMRLIKSQGVLKHLFTYWRQAEDLTSFIHVLDQMRFNAREKSYQIFNTKYYLQNKGEPTVTSNPFLMTTDFMILTELANRLTHIRNLLQSLIIPNLKMELMEGEVSIKEIKKEYHLENE